MEPRTRRKEHGEKQLSLGQFVTILSPKPLPDYNSLFLLLPFLWKSPLSQMPKANGRQTPFSLQHLAWDPQLFQLHILLQLTKEVCIKNLSSKLKAEKQEKCRNVRNRETQYRTEFLQARRAQVWKIHQWGEVWLRSKDAAHIAL